MQLNYILTGFTAAFLTVFIGQFLLPFMVLSSDWYLVFGSASSLVFTSIATYAIVRHRLLDIGVAFRNFLIHGLTGLILIIVIMVPFLLNQVFPLRVEGPAQVLLILAATVMLGYFLPGLERRITHFVDQRIFKGRYDHQGALIKFSQFFRTLQPREETAEILAREIPIILQTSGGSVYLREVNSGNYCRAAACEPLNDIDSPAFIEPEHTLVQEIMNCKELLIKDELVYGVAGSNNRSKELELFKALEAEIVVPLGSPEQPFGLLFLGEKTDDNVFTTDDLQLLDALVGQAETALDNARLYEEILASKRQYETIIRHIQRGVISVNTELKILTLNQCASEILGVSADSPENQHLQLEKIAPSLAGMVRKTLASGFDQSPAEITLRQGARSFPCELETSVLLDARNRISGAVIVFQDLTERKKFEEEVRRMDRLASVGTLAAGIAHEIKNPLVSIQTFAQLLPERYEEVDFREKFGGVVRHEINRINRLIHSLLDFARPKKALPGTVNVAEVAGRVFTLLENQLQRNNINYNIDIAEDVPLIDADAEQLYQVIFNLVQNAMQSMDGHERQITVSVACENDKNGQSGKGMVLLKVIDTGRGIEKKDMEHIFDPFFSTKENGSGLGLSICHGILKEHNASIDVQSVIGKGTTFNVRFPPPSTN